MRTYATPRYLSTEQKQRNPYRTINRIYFLTEDSTEIKYDNMSHDVHFELQCYGDGDCGKCPYQNEYERHEYMTKDFGKLVIYHELSGESISPLCIFKLEFGQNEVAIRSDLLDSIPFMDSIQIGGRNYINVYRLILNNYRGTNGISYDTVFYNKEYGILKILAHDNRNLDLLKIE